MTRHEMDRIIVGNQIMIMRVLRSLIDLDMQVAIDIRVRDLQSLWRLEYSEEVGFSSSLGDHP